MLELMCVWNSSFLLLGHWRQEWNFLKYLFVHLCATWKLAPFKKEYIYIHIQQFKWSGFLFSYGATVWKRDRVTLCSTFYAGKLLLTHRRAWNFNHLLLIFLCQNNSLITVIWIHDIRQHSKFDGRACEFNCCTKKKILIITVISSFLIKWMRLFAMKEHYDRE